MTADVAAFMAARLDEAEAAAKAAWGIEWSWRDLAGPFRERPSIAHTAHIARHDPATVLRSIAADRRLLAELDRCQGDPGWDSAIMLAVRCRAMAWNAHPEYKTGWAP